MYLPAGRGVIHRFQLEAKMMTTIVTGTSPGSFQAPCNEPARPMIAGIANAEDRARIWPAIAGKHRNYAGYQKRTDREIPLVLLRPADS